MIRQAPDGTIPTAIMLPFIRGMSHNALGNDVDAQAASELAR